MCRIQIHVRCVPRAVRRERISDRARLVFDGVAVDVEHRRDDEADAAGDGKVGGTTEVVATHDPLLPYAHH